MGLHKVHHKDVLCFAAHFNIAVQKYGVKKEIKNKALEKLMVLQVLTDPVDSVQSGAEVPLEGVSAARKTDYDLKLQVRRLEIEADKEVKLQELEVEAMRMSSARMMAHTSEKLPPSQTLEGHKQSFDVNVLMKILPWCHFKRLTSVDLKELQLH